MNITALPSGERIDLDQFRPFFIRNTPWSRSVPCPATGGSHGGRFRTTKNTRRPDPAHGEKPGLGPEFREHETKKRGGETSPNRACSGPESTRPLWM